MVSLQRLALTGLILLGLTAPAMADPPIPPLTGRVVDLAQVLDARTVDALTRQLTDHEVSTTNQLVVVTLPSLENYSIEQWGRALLNGWGIGQRDKNNGVVLVVAPNDRRLRIEVGYGLEDVLTKSAASNIIEAVIVPRFKRGDLPGGVTAGVNAILATIDGTYHPLVEAPSGSANADRSIWRFAPFVIFPLFFIIIVVIGISRRSSSALRRQYYDTPGYGNTVYRGNRDNWHSRSSSRSSGGGFSGGGGRGGGGGASGRW